VADFRLPDLGENIESGEVINVLVSEGDSLSEDQPVIELETDKAVIEVPSSVSGTVTKVMISKGDQAKVGQALLVVDGDGASSTVAAPAEPEPEPEVVAAPAPEPAAVEAPAGSGPVEEMLPELGERIDAGDLASIPVSPGDTLEPVALPPAPIPPAGHRPDARPVPAAPSVRRMAREIGVDVAAVQGTSPGGRISEADVKAHSKKLHESRGAGPAVASVPLPDFSKWGDIENVPFSNVRRITAQRMGAAWSTIPHVTQFDQSDVTDLEVWRKEFGKQVEKAGAKLTPTAIILKVAAAALRKFPQFSASIDVAREQIIYKKYCHIGVAVDTKRGLLVPIIRDVDTKSITQISVELGEMAEKTRTGKVSVDDMQGGCFTVSNLGGIGGTAFTPIVNAPEVAILGVARGSARPVYVDDQLQPRTIMPLSLSYDHRVIDGADGARFLRYICQGLENPFFLAFEG
jgi:pyruvate dehydrogenase E2 component (dihydrolipoamide acetyltransferase)